MKNLLKVAAVALCMVFMGNFAKAQTKIGYISMDQVMQLMPELKTIQTQMQGIQKPYMDQLTTMNNDLQTMGKDYEAKQATMTDAVRLAKQSEIQDLQKRINDYTETARTAVDAKSNELLKPVIEKIRVAVTAVAKEKGYTYVVNSTTTEFVVAPPTDDLFVPVKAKLGLK